MQFGLHETTPAVTIFQIASRLLINYTNKFKYPPRPLETCIFTLVSMTRLCWKHLCWVTCKIWKRNNSSFRSRDVVRHNPQYRWSQVTIPRSLRVLTNEVNIGVFLCIILCQNIAIDPIICWITLKYLLYDLEL